MKRITRKDIDEMRAHGFDSETIRQAEDDERRTIAADRLCDRVRLAFEGIRLGEGVGLFEGQALDDYATSEVRAKSRAKDEHYSWDSINSVHLNACHSSLSFFDALGMRFHLPAFIIADLKGEYRMDMVFPLCHLSEHTRSQFMKLSKEQRRVVREYLLFLREDADQTFDLPHIDRALSDFWIEE
jgi:hypothetical protein